jgi:pyrroline-5-carboxylate reductase
MDFPHSIAIIGGGNLGIAIAKGLIASELLAPYNITITRRRTGLLAELAKHGVKVSADNRAATRTASIVILAVQPQQVNDILAEIKDDIDPEKHIVISVISGASISEITTVLGKNVPVVRAMPNTAIAIRESMTCLAAASEHQSALGIAQQIFDTVGATVVIHEEQMTSATALCACGIAFFLRAIRAASQGGIEIGFHADEAIKMAAQTARGAASLLLSGSHPESEIDKVTTPRGCTIAGLNEMEHQGFSSAMIRGITTASDKAMNLYVAKPTKN